MYQCTMEIAIAIAMSYTGIRAGIVSHGHFMSHLLKELEDHTSPGETTAPIALFHHQNVQMQKRGTGFHPEIPMVKCRRHGYKALATQNIPAIKAPQRLDGHRFSVSTLKCLQRPISTVAPFHPLSFQASRCTHRSMQPFAAARGYSPTHDRNPIETALKNNCCIVTQQKTVRGCATTTKLKIQHIRCMFHGKCERNPTSILISKQFKTIGFARKMHAITGFFEKSVVSILHHSWIPAVRDQNSVSLIQLLPSPKRAARMLQLSSLLQHLGAAEEGCSLTEMG